MTPLARGMLFASTLVCRPLKPRSGLVRALWSSTRRPSGRLGTRLASNQSDESDGDDDRTSASRMEKWVRVWACRPVMPMMPGGGAIKSCFPKFQGGLPYCADQVVVLLAPGQLMSAAATAAPQLSPDVLRMHSNQPYSVHSQTEPRSMHATRFAGRWNAQRAHCKLLPAAGFSSNFYS